ncbi:MAG: SipW-dependent-type signal peptide-containing protein [Lachnospiraceae bacterium]|nr:SipW-dependent-type signal peptide-containing protein [Lachnospiraceae bacterium]
MKNGKLVATLGAVALVAAVGVGSTLAYLTDETGTVTNTFTLGNVTFDEDMAGGLAENPVALNEDGKYVISDTEEWVTSNEYEKVTPNETVAKNPTAFVDADSENAWLFVRVSNSADYQAIDFDDAFTVVATTANYTDLRLTEEAVAGGQYEIFNQVTVADLENGAELDDITIKAALIQAEGVTAADAYGMAGDLLD